MKRFGEKAVIEAIKNGAVIRAWESFTLANGGYRVIIKGEQEGYITFDLFFKLKSNGIIEKDAWHYSYTDYRDKNTAYWNVTSERVHAETLAALAPVIAEETAENKEEPETMKTPYEKAIERNPESETAWRLPGYTGPVFTITYGHTGHGATDTAHFRTEKEYREHVEYCKRNGYEIHSATKTENGITETIPAETAQEKTDRENREHCKHIAEELEEYASGNVYRCTECGSICTIEEGEDADGFTVYRTSCGCTLEYEPEQLSVYDFIADAYDIEYRAGSDKEYRSAKIMVACGGPNIYIDTASRSVKLYWWTDYAEYPISSDACDELDNIMEELWGF